MSPDSPQRQDGAMQQVRRVIERLDQDGSLVADADGATHDVRTVSISMREGEALRKWILKEDATRTLEIGLAYGFSALFMCEALLQKGDPAAKHVVLDPFQATRFANCGLQVLEDAVVKHLVEYRAEVSQIALPEFLKEGRQFDLGFIDGNHRFDSVFLDLFYLGRLVNKGGLVMLDDYDLPGIKRAVSFFETNLDWTIEEESAPEDDHHWVVLRTARHADKRDFRYFVEF